MGGNMSSAISQKQTKSQIISAIAEDTKMNKKDIQVVLQSVKSLASRHLIKNGSGEFTIPEIGVKLRRVDKPARPAGKARNPFTGEMVDVEAKPASLSVRATAMKAIKDVVA